MKSNKTFKHLCHNLLFELAKRIEKNLLFFGSPCLYLLLISNRLFNFVIVCKNY